MTTYALLLDQRGQGCPMPVITLAGRIGDVAVGEVVAVLADDPASASDLPAWCALRGHSYLGETTVDGARAHLVRREA